MAYLTLTKGLTAIIDAEDVPRVEKHRWHAQCGRKAGTHYAATVKRGNRALHRFIMRARKGRVVDHINGNGLDNRKCNLRVVTHAENLRNCYFHRDPSMGGAPKVVRLGTALVERIDALVGREGRGAFMTEAIERLLAEREASAA